MAAPFDQMPTLAEFLHRAEACGCKEYSHLGLVGPRGPETVRILRSDTGGSAVLPNIADDERLTPTVLYNLCRKLKADLGYGVW